MFDYFMNLSLADFFLLSLVALALFLLFVIRKF